MSVEIQIVETNEIPTAIVWGESVPQSQMKTFYDHAFEAVFASIQQAGLHRAGPAYALYTAMGQGEDPHYDLEIGVPVNGEIDGSIELPDLETVFGSELPECKAATYRYTGSYDGLSQAWADFMVAIEARGLKTGQPRWEVYVTEPTPQTDPAELVTELYCALR